MDNTKSPSLSIPNLKPQAHQNRLNQLAGKIKAFKNIDPVTWQQQIRGEWGDGTNGGSLAQNMEIDKQQGRLYPKEWAQVPKCDGYKHSNGMSASAE